MLPVLIYKIAREVTKKGRYLLLCVTCSKWQCTLYDYFHTALNEALKKEDERLKIAIGEVMTRCWEKALRKYEKGHGFCVYIVL